MSDVPLGVFLSGGIDSSAVAAAAARAQGGGAVDSFAVGFREPSFDESAPARRMAEHLGTRHHQEMLTMDGARDLVTEVLDRLDEPLGDPSLLPTYLLCGFAHRHVTVALSGDGGDELFAGYDTFAALGPARLYRALVPAPLHRGLRRLADLLPLSGRNMSLDFRLRRALAGVGHGPELWHPLWLAPLAPEAIGDLLHTTIDVEELYSEALAIWRESASTDLADRGMEFYTRLYLPDDILAKVDRASMMHSLEARAAFLDNDLVDFVRRLPPTLKLKGGVRKYVLKEALRGAVPDDVLARPKKGFGVPLKDWLRALPYPGDRDLGVPIDLARVRRWDAEHRRGAADHRLFLWIWQVLQRHAL